eukprot:CAMPEP_0175885328 /NCGR_PEP_ID=MMETSP0107_2-20121207/45004_1 /TAXON_ID=195067 ORGANISM="Goniomonas pacifica, Strain CCMP1869" /NCGR_SAMPLE_ID=MMETSP0107_2 /ASSEMBLY_ACC=CAM_ASM_000203 /LENGTH=72 /DNA_ID=CAMNT_0017205555 /DNA_START=321 /DNA_END=536 /DNA_ORIENTATION=-
MNVGAGPRQQRCYCRVAFPGGKMQRCVTLSALVNTQRTPSWASNVTYRGGNSGTKTTHKPISSMNVGPGLHQ